MKAAEGEAALDHRRVLGGAVGSGSFSNQLPPGWCQQWGPDGADKPLAISVLLRRAWQEITHLSQHLPRLPQQRGCSSSTTLLDGKRCLFCRGKLLQKLASTTLPSSGTALPAACVAARTQTSGKPACLHCELICSLKMLDNVIK